MKKIAILGAGVCGLSLAYFLQKQDVSITIFEAKDGPGGWLQTERHNGALFECGPRSLRSTSKELDCLIQELGLSDEVLYTQDNAKKRYIVKNGRLQLLSFFRSELLWACLREPFMAKGMQDDESVESFFSRRIGKKATETFISALTAGIFASSPRKLSMRSCFQSLWEKEKSYGSLVKAALFSKKKARIRSFSFRDGIETLPKRLAKSLSATIYYNQRVKKVQEFDDKIVVVTDEPHEFDMVYSTIALPALSSILDKDDPIQKHLDIPTTSLVTVSCAFTEQLDIPSGFGFLCPENEDPNLLGIVFDSELFPEQNGGYKTRLSVMMGGERNPEMLSFSDEVLLAYTKEYLDKYLKIKAPIDYHILRRAKSAISRYPVGHYRTVSALEAEKRRLVLLGTALHGVSVGDSVTSAYRTSRGHLCVSDTQLMPGVMGRP